MPVILTHTNETERLYCVEESKFITIQEDRTSNSESLRDINIVTLDKIESDLQT